MLEWLRNLANVLEPSSDEILDGLRAFEAVYGRPFFPPKTCPFSQHVREHGVETRQFETTRHDN